MSELPVERETESTEAAILASALRAFSDRGFHGASVREIAKGSGVSSANVYNYVQSKSELLVKLLRRASDDQLAATRAALDAAGPDPEDRLAAAVRAYVRFDVERRVECLVASTEVRYLPPADRQRIVASRDQHDRLFHQLVEEGVTAGVFATPHSDLAVLAILTMCSGVTQWYRPNGPLGAEEIADRYARFALALVEATP